MNIEESAACLFAVAAQGQLTSSPAETEASRRTDAAKLSTVNWLTVDDVRLPFVLRDGQKYVVVKMVEAKLLSTYSDDYPGEIPVFSTYFLKEDEVKILNDLSRGIEKSCDSGNERETSWQQLTVEDEVVNIDQFMNFYIKVVDYYRQRDAQHSQQVAAISPIVLQPEEVVAADLLSPRLGQASVSPDNVMCHSTTDSGWVRINGFLIPYIKRSDGIALVPAKFFCTVPACNMTQITVMAHETECDKLNQMCQSIGEKDMFSIKTELVPLLPVCQARQLKVEFVELTSPSQASIDFYRSTRISCLETNVIANEHSINAVGQRHVPNSQQHARESLPYDFNEAMRRAACGLPSTSAQVNFLRDIRYQNPRGIQTSDGNYSPQGTVPKSIHGQLEHFSMDGRYDTRYQYQQPVYGHGHNPERTVAPHVSGGRLPSNQLNAHSMQPASSHVHQHPNLNASQMRKRQLTEDSYAVEQQYGYLDVPSVGSLSRQSMSAVHNSSNLNGYLEHADQTRRASYSSPVASNPYNSEGVAANVTRMMVATENGHKRMRPTRRYELVTAKSPVPFWSFEQTPDFSQQRSTVDVNASYEGNASSARQPQLLQQVVPHSPPMLIIRPFLYRGRTLWCIQKAGHKYVPLALLICAAFPEYINATQKISILLEAKANTAFTYISLDEEQALLEIFEKEPGKFLRSKLLVREDLLERVLDTIVNFIKARLL